MEAAAGNRHHHPQQRRRRFASLLTERLTFGEPAAGCQVETPARQGPGDFELGRCDTSAPVSLVGTVLLPAFDAYRIEKKNDVNVATSLESSRCSSSCEAGFDTFSAGS